MLFKISFHPRHQALRTIGPEVLGHHLIHFIPLIDFLSYIANYRLLSFYVVEARTMFNEFLLILTAKGYFLEISFVLNPTIIRPLVLGDV